MKIKLTTISLFVGAILILGPAIFNFSPSWWWYFFSMIGAVLVCIAGYDARADMSGLGTPGEDLLMSALRRLKKLKWWR